MATHAYTGPVPGDDLRTAKTPTRLSWGAVFAGVGRDDMDRGPFESK
jgi:hypothetical protein